MIIASLEASGYSRLDYSNPQDNWVDLIISLNQNESNFTVNNLIALGNITTGNITVDEIHINNPPLPCPVNTGQFDSNGSTRSCSPNVSYWIGLGNDIYYLAGNVGVGTDSPTQKLEVVGNTKIEGNLSLGDTLSLNQTNDDYIFKLFNGTLLIDADNGTNFTNDIFIEGNLSVFQVNIRSPESLTFGFPAFAMISASNFTRGGNFKKFIQSDGSLGVRTNINTSDGLFVLSSNPAPTVSVPIILGNSFNDVISMVKLPRAYDSPHPYGSILNEQDPLRIATEFRGTNLSMGFFGTTNIYEDFSFKKITDWTPIFVLHNNTNTEIKYNLSVDDDTFFVDSVNNKVGIGTTNPSVELEVIGNITAQNITSTEHMKAFELRADHLTVSHQHTPQNNLLFNWYDDGSEIFLNTSSAEAFNIETDSAKLVLYDNPNEANDYKLFQIFGKQAQDVAKLVITKGGAGNASYITRSFAVGVDSRDCGTFASHIKCDTSLTGGDFYVADEIEINHTLYSRKLNISQSAYFAVDSGNVGIGTISPTSKLVVNGNVNVSGNITSANVFIPQYIFTHTNVTLLVNGVSEWTNITFDQEITDINQGIIHNSLSLDNHTFTMSEDGIYMVNFDLDVEDTSAGASDIDTAARVIFINGTEVDGSVFEIDIIKQVTEFELSHHILARFNSGDSIVFQFIASDADVQISTHGSYGEHPDSASITINKVANIQG